MSFSVFCENSVPDNTYKLAFIGLDLGISITANEIWAIAREYNDPPHLGNVYLEILYASLKTRLEERYPDISVDYEIAGCFSRFMVNDKTFSSLDELYQLINTD